MLPKTTSPTHKPMQAMVPILATLALLIVTLPSYAADPQSQASQASQAPSGPAALSALDAPDIPHATCPSGGQCFADVPSSNVFYAFVNRIYQQDLVTGYPCGGAGEPCDPAGRPYYRPVNNVTRQQMAKFIDNARRLPGIHIDTATDPSPLYVRSIAANSVAIEAHSNDGIGVAADSVSDNGIYGQTSGDYTGDTTVAGVYGYDIGSGYGVRGGSSIGTGVYGQSGSGAGSIGVRGTSGSGIGVNGYSVGHWGVYGNTSTGYGVVGNGSSGVGVWGMTGGVSSTDYGVLGSAASPAQAGHFVGNVQVTGNLSKGGGSFKIDDPLDPANKYLYHSFVESPDMMNVYNGNVTTDDNGDATVTLPDYFQALNRDYRYQLTVIGQFAQAIVSEKVKDNHFSIKTDKPNVEVSWQVTGIRQDPYANAHRIPVEEEKTGDEKGKYLHPTEWGQPESSGIDYEEQQKMQAVPQSTP